MQQGRNSLKPCTISQSKTSQHRLTGLTQPKFGLNAPGWYGARLVVQGPNGADTVTKSAWLRVPEAIKAASPTSYISKSFAPTIFIHGVNDVTVPLTSSLDFFGKLNALGVPSALTAIQGAQHAFDVGALDAVEVMAQSIDLFLDRLLVNDKRLERADG